MSANGTDVDLLAIKQHGGFRCSTKPMLDQVFPKYFSAIAVPCQIGLEESAE